MRRLPSKIRNVLLNTGDASTEAALTLLVALGAHNREDVEANWNNPLTRAEFVKDLVTALGRSATAQGLRSLRPTLTDEVPQWAWGFVNVGFYMGIVKSDKDGRFRPSDPVTYAEAITALVRAVPGHEALVQPGTWPYNYLFYGVDEDFTGGVDVGFANLPATRGDAANMIAATLRKDHLDATGRPVHGTSVLAHRALRGQLKRTIGDAALTVDTFTLPLAPEVLLVGPQAIKQLVGSAVEVLVDTESRVSYLARI